MEWLIENMVGYLRANVNLAAWAGQDGQGDVRIYHGRAPEKRDLGGTRYVTMHTDIGGGEPWWPFGDAMNLDEIFVEFEIVDKSDGSGRAVTEGYEYLRRALEPPNVVAISGYTATESPSPSPEPTGKKILGIRRLGALRGPAIDENEEWRGLVSYEVLLRTLH